MSSIGEFRDLLKTESIRLQNLCDEWRDILKLNKLSEESMGKILSAVGLCELLINEKFRQFSGLIDKCEEDGLMKITFSDLQGFWDLVKIQVDDIDMKFNDLVILKQNQWKENNVENHIIREKKSVLSTATRNPPKILAKHWKCERSGSVKRSGNKVRVKSDTNVKADKKENIEFINPAQGSEPGTSSTLLGL
ncbi:disks large-associated protein 5-like [Periplaneta americana]|uniref:disks large-associated protein 5-like n=1 Tax=Periplaneta americana TaxID=6978 RepID=UPI0037E86541